MTNYKIVDVPVTMEKFFGKGKMLHPSLKLVESVVNTIPRGQVSTINILAKKLAKDFNVDVTCPMRFGNHIKKLAKQFPDLDSSTVPYWRVLRANETLVKTENYEACASKLEDEGFELSFKKPDQIKVIFDKDALFTF